ncbi:MAG TPA: phosphate ABC transporter substrate-binding/OmpA family protein [Saprospiraceae bacterium]|nr:phosphate ABC transporter substrate-binding/OmpA family protein [Saprospiraceae bacterium]
MATRLTTFSKFLITLLILGAIVGAGWYVLNKTSFGQNLREQSESEETEVNKSPEDKSKTSGTAGTDDVLDVQLVTWGGYAPGLYFNEGSEPSSRSRYMKDYGLKVRFHKNDDLGSAQSAWIADEYDVIVQTADAFPLYTSPDDLRALKPQAFMQVDWSRGGDVIIAKRGINSINDLKGKRVAVPEPSPSQTLLITALEAAGLQYSDIQIVASQDPIVAAQTFKAPNVDAAVVWSPFHLEAIREVAGSKVLISTNEQSHIIADIMFAKEEFIQNNREKIHAFYEGWMKGIAELRTTPSNQEKAATILAEFLEFPLDDAKGAMADVYWTGHGDNVNFFGLNPEYKGLKGSDLYEKMNKKFFELKQMEKTGPPWRSVAYSGAVQAAMTKLTGDAYQAEGGKKFTPVTASERTAPAISSKPVSINFASGKFALDENAKTIIDLQFADVARSFANVKVRIEGNTDNVGGAQMNQRLSEQRAQAVADYLRTQYNMDPNRFIIVGNGPTKPVPGCETNATDACRAKNRRTEFQLVAG